MQKWGVLQNNKHIDPRKTFGLTDVIFCPRKIRYSKNINILSWQIELFYKITFALQLPDKLIYWQLEHLR